MTMLLQAAPTPKKGRRDPTRSAGLRKTGRSLANQRVFALHKTLRQTLQEHDLLGLKQRETPYPQWIEPPARKLERSESVLRTLVSQALASPPNWLYLTIMAAVQKGVTQAGEELKAAVEQLDIRPLGELHAVAAGVEIQGISAETQRRVLRAMGTALQLEQTPTELMREVRQSLEKVTRARLILLVNTAIVRALNAGKLFAYRENGVKKVGIEPEWLPRIMAHRDHRLHHGVIKDADLVNVLTAGDDDVCDECEDIAASGPYEIDEAQDMIPAHLNCRCAFTPADDLRFALTEEREERLAEEEDDDEPPRRRR